MRPSASGCSVRGATLPHGVRECPLLVRSVKLTSSQPLFPICLCELSKRLSSLASDLLNAGRHLLPVSLGDSDVQLGHVCRHLLREAELGQFLLELLWRERHVLNFSSKYCGEGIGDLEAVSAFGCHRFSFVGEWWVLHQCTRVTLAQ